ncbi:hypothetical protein Hgul01_05348 [Herpetosiphon gulosus]|uniref:Uncharacterized protein n=2 Tax=Herpetosiphon gulosus TaxID=1973496 RepID=A0ABP9X9J4_9CHLR
MLYPPHIIVTVSLYPSGLRVAPLWLGGIDIQFRYQHSPHDWFCYFFGTEDGMLMPGETITGGIRMLSPDEHTGQFWVGMPFQLAFGQPAVADGTILDVVESHMRAPTPCS